jgi:hypothetical protein
MAATTDKFFKSAPLWSGTIGAGGIADSSVDTFPLSSALGLVNGEVYAFTVDRVDGNGAKTLAKREVIIGKVSGSNVIDCVRGSEGTAQSHSAGAVVEVLFTAKQWNDTVDGLLEEHSATGEHKTPWVDVTDGETVAFNLYDGYRQRVTLGGNRTLEVSNAKSGIAFIIQLTQDATGSRSVTWFDGITWIDGAAPSLTTTASKSDYFGFLQTDTDEYLGFVLAMGI